MVKMRLGSSGKIRRLSSGAILTGSRPNGVNNMGMNLSHQTYYAEMIPWIDMMKCASDWVNNNPFNGTEPIVVDANHWPQSVAVGQQLLSYIINISATGVPHFNTVGHYLIVKYDGDGSGYGTAWSIGSTGTGGSVSVVSHDTGAKRLVLSVTHSAVANNYLQIAYNSINVADRLRNIKIMREEYEAAYDAGDRFDPVFLAEKAPFKALRFMNWSHMNGSLEDTWSERRTLASRNYSGGGWSNSKIYAKEPSVPYEEQIALANILYPGGLECIQVNIPHLAVTDWWTGLAVLLRDTLNTAIKIRFERSNELWNFQFDQTDDDFDAGQILYPSEPNIYYRGTYYSAHQARLMIADFETVFAGQMHRLCRVFAWQKDTVGRSEAMVEWEGLENHLDKWQVAPYFSGWGRNDAPNQLGKDPQATTTAGSHWPDITLNLTSAQILQGCHDALNDSGQIGHIQDLYDLMAAKGIGLDWYECGQHLTASTTPLQNNDALTAVFVAVNRDPGMRAMYLEYWRWGKQFTTGGYMFHYADYFGYGKYGSWGLKEYQGQDPAAAYKWLGTMDFIAENA